MKVLITGASRGIGKGIATFLGKNGFEVGLMARSEDRLTHLAREINGSGGKAVFTVCDIRNPVEVRSAVSRLIDEMGGVEALVNNAGVVIRKDAFNLSLEEWHRMMETNVNGLFYTTREVLPHLKNLGRGHIINISSISGYLPLPGGSGYAASKYAVTGFSESLFQEVRDFGIKVTTVFPGSVDTDSHRNGSVETTWKVAPEEVGAACRDILFTSPGNCISRVEIRPLRRPPK